MKHTFQFGRSLLLMTFVITLLISCDKDNDDNMATNTTIADVVVNSPDYSTLEAAVVKANLATTLGSPGPFTVFAPDNAAFTASNISDATLNGLTQQQTANILLYHTLPAKIMAADVPAGPNAKVTTASGDSVFVTKNASGVFINGIKVEQADISATNGVIHRIGRVLMPPAGDLIATAQIPGTGLDSLVKAVLRATNGPGGDPSLVTTLQTGQFTLFAPNNGAFTSLLTALGFTNIDQIPVTTLLSVLRYHLVSGRAFSSDLSNTNITMVSGGSTSLNLTNGSNGGPTITGSGNGSSRSNIVATNIMARNGVVHVIDRVLLPS